MSTTRTPEATIGDVVSGALARSTGRLTRHAAAVQRTDDAEELHQCRVAARRLRSDLRTFRSLVDTEWTEQLRGELAWLGGVLGDVRDADVLHAALLAETAVLGPDDRPAAASLVAMVEGQRTAARAEMVVVLGGDRYHALADALGVAADAPKFERDPGQPARPVVAKLVRRAWARLEREVADLEEPADDAALHEVRIKAKRLRYACDAAATAWGKKVSRLADAAASVQDVLGRLQDAAVAEDWLRSAAAREPSSALAAGVLIARRQAEAAACRAAFPTAWRSAARPKLRKWLR
jgi:CHAD domain-containing protein